MRRSISSIMISIAAGLLILLTVPSAHAQPIVLHFDELPAMAYFPLGPVPEQARLSDQYLKTHGVQFRSKSPYVAVVRLGVNHATSGTNAIAGADAGGVLTYDHLHPIEVRFLDPKNPTKPATTDFVSVRIDLWGGSSKVTMTAFDVDGKSIDSCTIIERGGETMKVSGQGIHSVQIQGGRGVALDDFTFNPVNVEAPAANEPKIVAKPPLQEEPPPAPAANEAKKVAKPSLQEEPPLAEAEADLVGTTGWIILLSLGFMLVFGVLAGAAGIAAIVYSRVETRG